MKDYTIVNVYINNDIKSSISDKVDCILCALNNYKNGNSVKYTDDIETFM